MTTERAALYSPQGEYLGEIPTHVEYAPGVSGPIIPEIAAIIGRLAGGALRGRNTEVLTQLLVTTGLTRDPERLREVARRNDAQLDEWFDLVDWGAAAELATSSALDNRPGLVACALDPATALPLLALGALSGVALVKVFDL